MANNWRFFWLLIGLNHQSLILIGRQLRKYAPWYDRMNYGECLLIEGHYNTEWDPHSRRLYTESARQGSIHVTCLQYGFTNGFIPSKIKINNDKNPRNIWLWVMWLNSYTCRVYNDSLTMFMVFHLPKSYFPESLKLFSHYSCLHSFLFFCGSKRIRNIKNSIFFIRI